MTQPHAGDGAGPPLTGVERVDEALQGLVGLHDRPLPEHHERLRRAHAALQEALEADLSVPEPERQRDQGQPPRP